MIGGKLRRAVERLSRNRVICRRLPREFGRHPIYVSPDARLRFLLPGKRAFDGDLIDFADRFIRPGMVVMDIGANVGEFALVAAHRAGRSGAVLAVEADAFLASLLQRTIAHADNRGVNLDCLCAAISAQVGISRFNIAERGRAANSLVFGGTSQMGGVRQSLLVPTVRIDDLVSAWRVPDFVKIDVEGAELEAFGGASTLLSRHRSSIFFEATREQDQIRRLLGSHGYELFDPAERTLIRPLDRCLFNTLAVHQSKLDALRSAATAG